jgi:hypothetical protein
MLEDPSFIPVIKLTVPSPIYGDFDWKDAFSRILGEYNEVLIRRKVLTTPAIELDGELFSSKRGFVKSELRRSIKNCIRHRRTSLLIMDEASHLLITRSRSTFLHQFELLKSLCEDFGVTLLLSGAYDLLAIQQFNGQLIRRTKIVHFSAIPGRTLPIPRTWPARHSGMPSIRCWSGCPSKSRTDWLSGSTTSSCIPWALSAC